jgi:hypothetical protein
MRLTDTGSSRKIICQSNVKAAIFKMDPSLISLYLCNITQKMIYYARVQIKGDIIKSIDHTFKVLNALFEKARAI